MKKIVSLILIVLFITACSAKDSKKDEYYLTYNGHDIKLDTVYNENTHGKSNDSFESANCAFGDRDVTYIYNDIEVETYGNKNNELIIYTIRLTSENVKTNEGIGLYDSIDDAILKYGDKYSKDDNKYTYTKGSTSLIILTDNGLIESIEYQLNNLS